MADVEVLTMFAPGHDKLYVQSQAHSDTLATDPDLDSLFDETEDNIAEDTTVDTQHRTPAIRIGPPIRGLHFHPTELLPQELVEMVMQKCITAYFQDGNVNQVMLFERADKIGEGHAPDTDTSLNSTLPTFLTDLLATLSKLLRPTLPGQAHALLFPPPSARTHARQVIINHYNPGEGITPHVDLLDRFGDGIIGVSMGSGCVMKFQKVEYDDGLDDEGDDAAKDWEVYLPSGSMYVMTDEARHEWTHGIEKRREDWVEDEVASGSDLDGVGSAVTARGRWIPRSVRVSITFRWLLPGADVVGSGLA
ncbi:hypothetical protein EIP91_003626 [Steccherinum ochraceum]|uniref:Fe2OG dioxygenase domain-containing protein n=1 Tax=Steccherinum ochraceum TaxID=92696 RepID=A0A4R0RIN0_9APHY|nr:hypothetical protein EIP91_003626 [Steccherinum ochraceum]